MDMKGKDARTISATEARVHFGELLKSLADGDVLIEKGGIPVAVLSAAPRWGSREPGPKEVPMERFPVLMNANAGVVAKAPAPNGWARLEAATSAGWVGVDTDAAIADVYRWRDEGGTRSFSFNDSAETDDDDGPTLPDRQRRVHQRDAQEQRVADGDAPKYRA